MREESTYRLHIAPRTDRCLALFAPLALTGAASHLSHPPV
jgi:hypothetical protein